MDRRPTAPGKEKGRASGIKRLMIADLDAVLSFCAV
jgi:hypothetical protein